MGRFLIIFWLNLIKNCCSCLAAAVACKMRLVGLVYTWRTFTGVKLNSSRT